MNTSTLQVGQEVGVVRVSSGMHMRYASQRFGTVTKITPKSGQIVVKAGDEELRFNKDGYQMKVNRWNEHHLIEADALRTHLAEEKAQHEAQKRACDLADLLAARKHCGRYHINDEQKQAIIEAAKAL